jgi:hypothetical protein
MAVVGFATLFSGAINEYFAAAGTAALLTFVLPLTIAAPMSAVPARLEGWALAAGAGIAAHMLLWPARTRAVEHAQVKPVFRDSVRAAVGLAVAVFIAQRMDLQHSFWVVLGTLSVLRSNALSTGWSILSALAGTAVGIVIGAALVIAIGTHHAVLWGVLPFAILLAAYAPRAISFAAGQAGFTVALFVLFNLIQPSGWRVGLVRLEDVAIGFGVSLGVGLLFWPRGNTDHRLSESPGFGALGRRIPGRGYSSPWNW